MRMAQPGLVPPHQQRTPMMVSMTQPPPVSMQGNVLKITLKFFLRNTKEILIISELDSTILPNILINQQDEPDF